MNRITYFLMASMLWVLVACGGGAEQTTTTTETESTEAETQTPASTPEVANYTIEVLKDSIKSPRKEMKATLASTDVVINYGSPSVKGRTIWGDLVPYDKVWRTGADEATIFTTKRDISVAGQSLKAGSYSLFSIPSESDWTIIFNDEAEQWGAYDYDESKDVLRAKVVPQASEEMAEQLDFKVIDDQIVLVWEKLMVPFKITAAGE